MTPPREPAEEVVEAPTAMAAMMDGSSTATILGLPAVDEIVDEDAAPTQLAWSEYNDTGNEPVLYAGEPYDDIVAQPVRIGRPVEPPRRPRRRRRFPQLFLGLGALVAMAAIGSVAYTLTSTTDHRVPPAAPTTSATVPPPRPAPSSAPPTPSAVPPPPSAAPTPSVAPPPSSPEPAVTTTYQTPETTTTTQPPTTTTAPDTATTTPPPTTTTAPMTTQYLTVPFMPVPIPVQVPQSGG